MMYIRMRLKKPTTIITPEALFFRLLYSFSLLSCGQKNAHVVPRNDVTGISTTASIHVQSCAGLVIVSSAFVGDRKAGPVKYVHHWVTVPG